MDKSSKILIVGAGPTGLVVHHFLKKAGFYRVRHIDKSLTAAQESRAIAVHAFTLHVILKELGLEQEFKNKGNPIHRFVFEKAGKVLQTLELPRFICSIPQSVTEQILGENIQVERGFECLYADEMGNARIKRRDELIEEDTYDLIVGADGTHSTVRQMLGIDFEGKTYPQTWSLKDVVFDIPPCLSDTAKIELHPQGKLLMMMGMQNGVYRVFSNTQQLEKILPKQIKITSTYWDANYHVHCRIAKRFCKGKCVIMGDAAHTSSPAGGTGMNRGIEDAYFFVKALESNQIAQWESKRRASQKALLKITDRLHRFMTLKGSFVEIIRPWLIQHVMGLKWVQKWVFSRFSPPY